MTVDHLSTHLHGGAALAARRIHDSLATAGVQSRFWYAHRGATPPADSTYRVIRWSAQRGLGWEQMIGRIRSTWLRLERKRSLRDRAEGLGPFNHARTGWNTRYDRTVLSGDVLHLHWVAKLIDYPAFFGSVPDDQPIVWTLHDMHPFTGGCHYTTGCTAFESVCRNCPQLGIRGEDDLAHRIFREKERALQGKNLHIVAASRWLEGQARSSSLFSHARSLRTIHYGFDVETFAPHARSAARRELGIPDERTVVGFGAHWISDRRKGVRELLQALALMERPVLGLAFGRGELPAVEDSGEIRSVGYVADASKQSRLYSAMDVFVMPSLEEAFGMTGLEAMACGVPVVAFAAGGITDYVRQGETGMLVKVGDVRELARSIEWIVDNPSASRKMGENAAEMVAREYNRALCARKYRELYASVLAERRGTA